MYITVICTKNSISQYMKQQGLRSRTESFMTGFFELKRIYLLILLGNCVIIASPFNGIIVK